MPFLRRVAATRTAIRQCVTASLAEPLLVGLVALTLIAFPSSADSRAPHSKPPAASLAIQPTISWVATGDGFWDVASNWRDTNNVTRVPTATDDVLINGAATNTWLILRDRVCFGT
jgi:hypothetical protein